MDARKEGEELVQEEAVHNCNDKNWSSFLCVLGLSSICGKNIECLYTDFGLIKYKLLFSQIIYPRITTPTTFESFYLLFCCEGFLNEFCAPFQNNHYIPLVLKKNYDIGYLVSNYANYSYVAKALSNSTFS